ncbi:MAG: bga 1 [Bacteroidetes bacterium]|nr:bga 1 [Bacteroidota bacterium]
MKEGNPQIPFLKIVPLKFIAALLVCFGFLIALPLPCVAQESFKVGDKTFLLNNKPFVIKAAEIHYPRIPKEYWEHRIEMCKALGMNTICLYVFWNYHEQEEGEYDFKGQKDIAAFCRLAQKHHLYVIVRPGPYVCAEWEMGGLPWWLLKKQDIKLRKLDSYYMDRVGLFMNQVGKELADLQITRGGNIIMVQVENEYGSFGIDKPYVSAIRDIVKKAGFTDVPLFQCDWSSNFENNALDDLLWTVNFGTGANIQKQFERLQQLRPNTPLMCSEYWSGWFDHWGAKHETRSAQELVKGMKEMLDKNISFSLYMTHGGTSFGHWGGANFPNFSPTCTSYDYDAPINESGKVTPKYFQVRELLKKYLPDGESLEQVPDSIRTIAIPSFELNEVAPVFDNLPVAKKSKDVQPMEFFDQGWGSILYRTILEKSNEEQMLIITEAHDWTQIFIDGKKVGTLNRLKGENRIKLPPVKEGARLDILVEAMGRMNFGAGIYDWKGITEKVELKSASGLKDLKDWFVYNLPVDYSFVSKKKYEQNIKTDGMPAYFKGFFVIDKLGDTFLDMTGWGKGLVWVNGYSMGRYWKIGPQQTLYVPGCWLRKGKNEVIVLDMAPSKQTLKGLRQPILDALDGSGAQTHRKQDEKLNLKDEIPAYEGSFREGNGWQQVKFGKQLSARYFCIEALNAYNESDYAAIAELEILGANGQKISRQHWKIVYADSEETEAANNLATNIFDLQESTIWHTQYTKEKTKYPHSIVIDLGEDVLISGFSYLPRAEQNKPGMIKDYRIYVSTKSYKLK